MVSPLAACSARRTFCRVSTRVWCFPSAPSAAGMNSSLTWVSFAPRILATTSSMRQPITSSTRPDLPWPTPTMRAPGFSVPSTAAGPPAMISRITTTSSWRCSCAPMPSSDSDIAWLKFSAVRGVK
ncbi:hypothetical protein G6F31_020814 [Rhizopus arrhizus]|nr:hypothetical protein G6F31_020814 [Rhizopus arrhizus]